MTEYIKQMRKFVGHAPIMQCGASVIVYSNGKVLLQLRKDNGQWGYHGGTVELGERVEETASRELFEETGLIANKLSLFGVFSGEELHYIYPNGDEVYNIDTVFVCEDFSGEPKSQTDETIGLCWFSIDELPDNICPPIRPALIKFVESKKTI